MPDLDRNRLLAELRLTQLLGELEPGWPAAPTLIEARLGCTVAAVRLGPVGQMGGVTLRPGDDLTPAQRDTLAVVQAEI